LPTLRLRFGLLSSYFISCALSPITDLPRGAESHIILSIFAYSVLFLAALHAILLAIQNKELKNRTKTKSLLLVLCRHYKRWSRYYLTLLAFGFGFIIFSYY
jgi:ABC-type uncharacterized transport system permease subunit